MKLTELFTTYAPQKFVRSTWIAKLIGLSSVEGEGRNREEAIDNLLTNIRRSLDGEYTPSLIVFKEHIALIWRSQDRWYYTIQYNTHQGRIQSNFHLFDVSQYAECERAARRHLADYATDTCYHPEEAVEIIKDETDRREFIRRAYRTREIEYLMETEGLDWYQANLKLDGLRT